MIFILYSARGGCFLIKTLTKVCNETPGVIVFLVDCVELKVSLYLTSLCCFLCNLSMFIHTEDKASLRHELSSGRLRMGRWERLLGQYVLVRAVTKETFWLMTKYREEAELNTLTLNKLYHPYHLFPLQRDWILCIWVCNPITCLRTSPTFQPCLQWCSLKERPLPW